MKSIEYLLKAYGMAKESKRGLVNLFHDNLLFFLELTELTYSYIQLSIKWLLIIIYMSCIHSNCIEINN